MVLEDYGCVEVSGPLEPLAEGFVRELSERGYTRLSATNQLRVFAFVSRWLEQAELRPEALAAKEVASILHARRRAGYTCWTSSRGLAPTLAYLRTVGASPQPHQLRANWRTRLLERYAQYMASERGLAADTIASRVRVARAFLSWRRRRRSVRGVRVADVRRFFGRQVRGLSSPSAAIVATALRSFLRFLHVVGQVDSSLVYAVPPIAGWRLARLPRGVSEQTVKRLLRSCNRRTAVGQRDYAILRLLVRLGLRRCEVARLTLEDVDWRGGALVVRGKGRSIARLPLPADVGAALAAYAEQRGSSPSRALFLRTRAPAGPLSAMAVGAIVKNAARRAGVEGVSAHRLRHTVATRMLRNGGTLAEIAEVLRHKSTVTTSIYAKVDRVALRELAQPWPGGAV